MQNTTNFVVLQFDMVGFADRSTSRTHQLPHPTFKPGRDALHTSGRIDCCKHLYRSGTVHSDPANPSLLTLKRKPATTVRSAYLTRSTGYHAPIILSGAWMNCHRKTMSLSTTRKHCCDRIPCALSPSSLDVPGGRIASIS